LYCIYLGNYRQALSFCQMALTGFSELGNRHGVAHALDSLGYAHHFLGESAQAIACYQQSLDAFREYGDRFSEADTLSHLGDTHHAIGNPQAARRAWQAALSILSDLHHPDASQVRAKLANLDAQALSSAKGPGAGGLDVTPCEPLRAGRR
jgi:tetratricopeptide (TPR) repeat protein